METKIILELIINVLEVLVNENIIKDITNNEECLSFRYNDNAYTIQHIISQFYKYLIIEIKENEMIKNVVEIIEGVDEYFECTTINYIEHNIREFLFWDIIFTDVKEFINVIKELEND